MEARIYEIADGKFRVIWQSSRTAYSFEEALALAVLPEPPPPLRPRTQVSPEVAAPPRRPGRSSTPRRRLVAPLTQARRRAMSGVPALVIVIAIEDAKPRFITLADASEETRLADWLRSCPGLGELVDAAVRLAGSSP